MAIRTPFSHWKGYWFVWQGCGSEGACRGILHGKILPWSELGVQLAALAISRVEYVSQVLPKPEVRSVVSLQWKNCASLLFKPELYSLSVCLPHSAGSGTVDFPSPSTVAKHQLWDTDTHTHKFSSSSMIDHTKHFSEVCTTSVVRWRLMLKFVSTTILQGR